ncbi:MAG: hypothetical protein ACRDMH_12670 [Solirubrobacterales bacterium]
MHHLLRAFGVPGTEAARDPEPPAREYRRKGGGTITPQDPATALLLDIESSFDDLSVRMYHGMFTEDDEGNQDGN